MMRSGLGEYRYGIFLMAFVALGFVGYAEDQSLTFNQADKEEDCSSNLCPVCGFAQKPMKMSFGNVGPELVSCASCGRLLLLDIRMEGGFDPKTGVLWDGGPKFVGYAPVIDPNLSFHGDLPLHIAIDERNTKAIEKLLDMGADVNSYNPSSGYTPLIEALDGPGLVYLRMDILKMLISNGADVNRRGKQFSRTALFYAVSKRHETAVQAVRLLLEHGADVNIRDKQGNTALHIIASEICYIKPSTQSNYTEIVRILTSSGADTNLKNNEDLTPAEVADQWVKKTEKASWRSHDVDFENIVGQFRKGPE